MTDYLTVVEVVSLAVWIEIALKVMPFSRLLQGLNRHRQADHQQRLCAARSQRLIEVRDRRL